MSKILNSKEKVPLKCTTQYRNKYLLATQLYREEEEELTRPLTTSVYYFYTTFPLQINYKIKFF